MHEKRSRKWQITINNPKEKGFTHDVIKLKLAMFKSMLYWCMCDEIGENGTYHTHIYLALSNATRFSTLKGRFNGAHFELVMGTSQDNRDYVKKEGKHLKDKKKVTNIAETFEEYGQMPLERKGERNDLYDLQDMVSQGMSNYEIINECPIYSFHIDKIERIRQTFSEEKYKNVFRKLETIYIFGDTGTGKTRNVMEEYGYENVFRITDYAHPFDNYKGQEVIIFEEFRSSLKIQDMLNYLDGYPLELPCRYSNKFACYTKVFIISNIDIRNQYEMVQLESEKTWKAFLRRINQVRMYTKDIILQGDVEEYYNNSLHLYTSTKML